MSFQVSQVWEDKKRGNRRWAVERRQSVFRVNVLYHILVGHGFVILNENGNSKSSSYYFKMKEINLDNSVSNFLGRWEQSCIKHLTVSLMEPKSRQVLISISWTIVLGVTQSQLVIQEHSVLDCYNLEGYIHPTLQPHLYSTWNTSNNKTDHVVIISK